MQKRPFSLVVGAVLAAIVAYLVSQSRAPQTTLDNEQALMPGLSEHLNDITRVTISGPGTETKVTLDRGESRWTVGQRDGYVADTAKIRKLLIELGEARLIEQKTARPENYATLGVDDIAKDDAGGVQVSVEGLADAPAVIIGKAARTAGAVYVRRADEPESWAANKRLRIEQDPTDWLVKDIVDIRPARVTSVRIEHPDGEVFEANRGDLNFDVAGLPDGAALSSPSAANSVSQVFDNLRFDDVQAAASLDWDEREKTVATFITNDGLTLTASVAAGEGKYYLALNTAAVPVDPSQLAADATTVDADGVQADGPSPEDKAAAMLEAMSDQSRGINARVNGWVYTIPLFKYEQLTRRVADVIAGEDGEMGPS